VGLAFANALEMTAPWRSDVLRLGIVATTFVAVMVLHAPALADVCDLLAGFARPLAT
jgi:hypothetical protein